MTITVEATYANGVLRPDQPLPLAENEKVQVVNVNNGERLETYLIKGQRGSGIVCLNGPAARKGLPGDVVIIITYAAMDFESAKTYKPVIIFPKDGNRKAPP